MEPTNTENYRTDSSVNLCELFEIVLAQNNNLNCLLKQFSVDIERYRHIIQTTSLGSLNVSTFNDYLHYTPLIMSQMQQKLSVKDFNKFAAYKQHIDAIVLDTFTLLV